jgi:flavin reductase (DIM6/NTAB) family NADH-FMN oxidoreductase RutF
MITNQPRASDPSWFRKVLGQYPTGVCVVTAAGPDGAPAGMTVGSFTSVSLEPPLVAFLPSASSTSWARIQSAGHFCVNILASDQETVCRAFASRNADKFAGLEWRPAASGAPILEQAVAWIDCSLKSVQEAGDHYIVLGQVRDLDVQRPSLPLLFFQGGYGRFHPHSLAIRDERFATQLRLVDRVRPLMERTAEQLGAQVVAAHCDGVELTLLASAGRPVISQAVIGQRMPVTPPIGIWWMAFAADEEIEAWLRPVASDQRLAYLEALAAIGRRGFCFGPGAVYAEVQTILGQRATHGAEPTLSELEQLQRLAFDPLEYVVDEKSLERPSANPSLWAPVVGQDGVVSLGLMITAAGDTDKPLRHHADALLNLVSEVAELHAELQLSAGG